MPTRRQLLIDNPDKEDYDGDVEEENNPTPDEVDPPINDVPMHSSSITVYNL